MKARATGAAVLCAAVLCPPAPGHAADGTLTVTGTNSAVAWLTVKRTVRYDVHAARVDIGTGRFGGFAIGRDWATLRSLHDPRAQPTFDGDSFTHGVLKPGRYKVRLFTDGQHVTAKIPWSGADVTVEPRTPIDARVQIAHAYAPELDGTVAVTLPQDGRKGVNTSVMTQYESVVGPNMTIKACITRTQNTCDRSRLRLVQRIGGQGLNGFTLQLSDYNSDPTKGHFVRGEVIGTTAGLLTVVTLRYYD